MEPLTKRSKIKHLPEDLRSVAEAMLREKFGHEYSCCRETICEECEDYFCEECSAPYDQFSQIDWNMCRNCYDCRQENWSKKEDWSKKYATYTYSVDKSFTQSTGNYIGEFPQLTIPNLSDVIIKLHNYEKINHWKAFYSDTIRSKR